MPNNEMILSCNTAKLNLPMLNEQERKVHVFRDLNNNLLSVGQLCDARYDVKFTKHKATVHNNNNILLTAKRDHTNGLWRSPLTEYTSKINNVGTTAHCNHTQNHRNNTNSYLQQHTKLDKSHTACFNNVQDYTNIQDAISYLQAAVYPPVKTTLVQAIKSGTFASWPGTTLDNVNKHYKRIIATAKGHMAHTRRNTRSTQPKPTPDEEKDKTTTEDFEPMDILPQLTDKVYAIITELDGKIYTDLTGRFPTTSIKGKKYVLILYEYDGNAILAEPMKSRSDTEAVRAYTVIYKQLTDAGLHPKFQMMDNDA
jgi:hypothetical protein